MNQSLQKNLGILTLFILHGALTYGLNTFNKIGQCAFVFVLIGLLTNLIAYKWGNKKALSIAFLSTLLCFIASANKTYFIQGQPVSGLFLASYLSLFTSCAGGVIFFSYFVKQRTESPFVLSLLSVVLSAMIDGFMMAIFFINIYPLMRVMAIFAKEVGFKALYAGGFYALTHITGRMPLSFRKWINRALFNKNNAKGKK